MELKPIKTKADRLLIYQDVLDNAELGYFSNGLCILLRDCSVHDFNVFGYTQTRIYFPEFGKHYPVSPDGVHYTQEAVRKGSLENWRIAVLKDCIEQCKTD